MPIKSQGDPKMKLSLPKIIFGTSALGNLYIEQPEHIKTKILEECIGLSGNSVVFDSAGKYGAGLALEMLGKILGKLDTKSKNIIISNKLGWYRIPLTTEEPTFEPGIWKNLKYDAVQRISYNGILECFEQGNHLLGNKFIPQLLSVHDPDEYLASAKSSKEYNQLLFEITEAYRALQQVKDNGKVSAIGIGAKNWKVIQVLSKHISFDWVMFANSMTIMNHPKELICFMEELKDKGILIINSAVFQAGFILGGEYYDYKKIKPDTQENIARFKWREKFHSLCQKFNISPMVACVNFALNAPGVCSISLNTSNPAHVKTNVDSIKAEVPKEFYLTMKKEKLISSDCYFI